MVMPDSTILVSELIEYVKRQFGDESGIQVTDSDIIRWLNMGTIEICAKNSVIQGTASTAGTANTGSYDLSDFVPNIIRIEDVYYGNKKLQPADKSTLQDGIQNSAGETGDPVFWYMWANTLRMWPVPNVDGTLQIDYIRRPDIVTNGGQYLPLPDLYYEQMCLFVLSKAFELDEDLEKSTAQRTLFETKLTEKTDLEKTLSGAFPVIKDDVHSAYYAADAADGWLY